MAGRKPKDSEIVDNFNPDKRDVDKVLRTLGKRLSTVDRKLKKLEDDGDLKEAFDMLSDMRTAYKEAGGLQKLLKLVKSDDKLLVAMVKELMKYEAALNAYDKRSQAQGHSTFVVVKGLYDVSSSSDEDLSPVADIINPLFER